MAWYDLLKRITAKDENVGQSYLNPFMHNVPKWSDTL